MRLASHPVPSTRFFPLFISLSFFLCIFSYSEAFHAVISGHETALCCRAARREFASQKRMLEIWHAALESRARSHFRGIVVRAAADTKSERQRTRGEGNNGFNNKNRTGMRAMRVNCAERSRNERTMRIKTMCVCVCEGKSRNSRKQEPEFGGEEWCLRHCDRKHSSMTVLVHILNIWNKRGTDFVVEINLDCIQEWRGTIGLTPSLDQRLLCKKLYNRRNNYIL